MAVDMFLELDGIKGEAKDSIHKGKIDILAWSWGESNSGTAHLGGGGGAGKVNMQDLSITKYIDKSSPELFVHCATGKHIPKATLICRKAGGNPLEYIKYMFEELLVSSVSTGGSGGEDRLTENISLNFGKIEFEYVEQDEKGGEVGKIKKGYDMRENVAS